jgi:NADH-quinone oxidoreductase subunit C
MSEEKPAEKPAAEPPKEGAEAKPAEAAAKPAEAAAKPAPATPAAKPASAAAPAHGAAPAKEEVPSEPGRFGKFLSGKGLDSKRVADSSGVETIEVAPEKLIETMLMLRDDPETQLNYLVFVAGVDSPESFDSVYQLWSYYDTSKELIVRVRIPKASIPEGQLPMVPSLAPYWETANWHERETFDLVGINYVGHPYLRRILNPWDWEGHPLRRDYKQVIDALNDKAAGSFR